MQKPARTFEEFLHSQGLKDWPEDGFTQDQGPLTTKFDTDYSLNGISDHLHKVAPLHGDIFTNMEAKIKELESLLKPYYSQLFTPIRTDDHLHCSNGQTFITQIHQTFDQSSGVSSEMNMIRKRKALYSNIPNEENVEDCKFPGFKITRLTELPGGLEAPQLLNRVTKSQDFKPGVVRFWEKHFLSEASVAVLQDSFWWFFLQKFQHNQEDQDHLYDRIADSFLALFWSVHHDVKDTFFKVYADFLCQAIFAVFFEAFPLSHAFFGDEFKNDLMDTIFQWLSGIRPPPYSWKKWNLNLLQRSGHDVTKDNEASVMCQLDFNMDDLIRDTKVTYAEKTSNEEEKDDTKSAADSPTGTPAIRESHYIGPGPDFRCVTFKLSGQSPLISHYLKMHEVTNVVTGVRGQKLKRSEICNVPPAVPTYQDVIKETQKLRKSLHKDYIALQDKTKKEIEEIEQQKIRVNREFVRMKKEVSGGNKQRNALLLEKMEKTSFFSNIFKKEDTSEDDVLNEDRI